MNFKKNSKLINNIIVGIMSIFLFFISVNIAPNRVNYNEYKTTKDQYELNTKSLESKIKNVNALDTKLYGIKNNIKSLNSEIEELKKQNN